MAKNIRVMIVDDHPLLREGLRTVISAEPDMIVVGEAADGVEAVERSHEYRPDVILMDLVMPRKDGVQAIIEILTDNPAAHILVLSSFSDENKAFPAIKAGASGYLLKEALPDELLDAIRKVANDQPVLPLDMMVRLIRDLKPHYAEVGKVQPHLTDRETEVLKLLARGLTNQEIADKLNISERTAIKHISNILDKLHLENRTQAALYAAREGLISLYPE